MTVMSVVGAFEVVVQVDRCTVWTFHDHLLQLDVTMLVIPWLISVVASDVRALVIAIWQEVTIVVTLMWVMMMVWVMEKMRMVEVWVGSLSEGHDHEDPM